MNQLKVINHLEKIHTYSDLEQLLCKICFHGAPTVKGVKPSTLICFRNTQSGQFRKLWDSYKLEIKDLIPFKFRELKKCGEGISVLFYWEDWLETIINQRVNHKYLQRKGYRETNDLETVLDILAHHFKDGCPHEIGLFLGYPLSDVMAFSSKHSNVCLGVGYWKVYSNIEKARLVFETYDQARSFIVQSLECGIKPQNLFVKYA